MKVYITDICGDICPENVTIGVADEARTARIKAAVFENIGAAAPEKKGTRRAKKTVRTLLLAAAIATLLTATAYAVASFTMDRRDVPAGETVSGCWTFVDGDGNITKQQKLNYPDASMVFTFTGPAEAHNKPEFRCFWLPSEPTFGGTDEDGWTGYLADEGDMTSAELPYIITSGSVPTTYKAQYVLSGKAEIVEETDWGVWHVQKITSDYSESETFAWMDRANYILLFDAERGYLLTVKGTSDMETLEHIARELEVRESDTHNPPSNLAETISILEPGRG